MTTLYKSWVICPCAVLSLCLYSGCYWHAGDLVHCLSKQVITFEVLTGLDKLVQMIESPIFTCKAQFDVILNSNNIFKLQL